MFGSTTTTKRAETETRATAAGNENSVLPQRLQRHTAGSTT